MNAKGRAPCYEVRDTFLRLRSASEFRLEYPHHISDARSHEVFCPFDATSPFRATAPGPSKPGSCCVLPLTMRFDALLPKRPPWCLSTRHVHGVQCPSELDQSKIIAASRPRYPLVRLAIRSYASLFRPEGHQGNLSPRTPTYPRRFRSRPQSVRRRPRFLSKVATFGSGSSTG